MRFRYSYKVSRSCMTGSSSPVSASAIIRTREDIKCLLCNISLPSEDQMELHRLGQRHCYTVADIKARGPEYHEYIFWTSIRTLIPTYASVFPSREAEDVIPTITTSGDFFRSHYLNCLPEGTFFCEVCDCTMSDVEQYTEHLSSSDHRDSLGPFTRLEVDYCQPVVHMSHMFFVGLVSREVFTSPSYFDENQIGIQLQWRILNKVPSSKSALMQASPECISKCFSVFHL